MFEDDPQRQMRYEAEIEKTKQKIATIENEIKKISNKT